MSLDRIILLTKTWIDRYKNLMPKNDVKYVMPFENRGEECGITLHHPHGQIYCYPFVPPVIEKEVISFQKENFILSMMESLEEWGYRFRTVDGITDFTERPSFEILSQSGWK